MVHQDGVLQVLEGAAAEGGGALAVLQGDAELVRGDLVVAVLSGPARDLRPEFLPAGTEGGGDRGHQGFRNMLSVPGIAGWLCGGDGGGGGAG